MSAQFSPCGTYRYWLSRDVNLYLDEPKRAVWVMLNPSTADANTNDATITRVENFTRDLGYDVAEVVNLYAFRATNPRALPWGHKERVGPENWSWVETAIKRSAVVICAWGAMPCARNAGREMLGTILELGKKPFCLGFTKSRAPKHPLYLPRETTLQPYV